MSDEHIKSVAKTQHFYEYIMMRLALAEDAMLVSDNANDRRTYESKSSEIKIILNEFSKIFESFLYTDR